MTFSEEDPRPQLNLRVSPDLRERVKEHADANDTTQSDVIRSALAEYLPEEETTGPDDPDLRETYQFLRHNADPDDRIEGKAAMNELSQKLSMPEQFVRNNRLRPLERAGWIDARWGKITVHEERHE